MLSILLAKKSTNKIWALYPSHRQMIVQAVLRRTRAKVDREYHEQALQQNKRILQIPIRMDQIIKSKSSRAKEDIPIRIGPRARRVTGLIAKAEWERE